MICVERRSVFIILFALKSSQGTDVHILADLGGVAIIEHLSSKWNFLALSGSNSTKCGVNIAQALFV